MADFTVTAGADGQQGPTAFSLTINNTATGPDRFEDRHSGDAGGERQPRKSTAMDGSNDVVFTLSIDGTGMVTMTDLRGVQEDALTNTPTRRRHHAGLRAGVGDGDGDRQ